jgi:glycosyltransferase involved in cell wall biosynthesis
MEAEKKVLVLIDRYLPILGGAQNNVHLINQGLIDQGYQVTVFTRMVVPGMKLKEEIDRVKIERFGKSPLRVLSKLVAAVQISLSLIRRRKEYGLVVCVPCAYYTDLLPVFFAAHFTSFPYIIRSTMTNNFDYMLASLKETKEDRLKKMTVPPSFWRRLLNGASAIIVQSPLIQFRAASRGIDQVTLIPNGVDTQRYRKAGLQEKEALRRKLSVPLDKLIVINSGRYIPEKNQITLIKAVECVEKNISPGKFHLIILGATEKKSTASNEYKLKEYVNNHGLKDVVDFVDDAKNVEEYLRTGDIFVLSTMFDEGMSNAALEAMASGLPIISSDIPQVKHMFPQEGIFYFHPTDVEMLAHHLVALSDSDDLRQESGDLMASFARTHYSQNLIVEKYEDVFASVLNGKAARGGC